MFSLNKLLVSDRLNAIPGVLCSQEDGTSESTSFLAFTASVYDNGRAFKCYAENSVTRTEDMKPMKVSTTIEVLCKWSIIPGVSLPSGRVTNARTGHPLRSVPARSHKVLPKRNLCLPFLYWLSLSKRVRRFKYLQKECDMGSYKSVKPVFSRRAL